MRPSRSAWSRSGTKFDMGIQEKAALLLGMPQGGQTDDRLLQFTIDLVRDCICNYCNLDEIPEALMNVAAAMVADAWRQSAFGREQLEPQTKGVSRGDVSFTFATAAEQMQLMITSPGFTRNYRAQLGAFRKLRW